jgi:hypothetical protein
MEITKQQILEISKSGNWESFYKLKKMFPEAFKVDNDINKPYKTNSGVLKYFISKKEAFGFNSDGQWCDYCKNYTLDDTGHNKWEEASVKEWESALIKEANKRGYKKGLLIQDIYNSDANDPNIKVSSENLDYETIKAGINQGKMSLRDSQGSIIFYNGLWAEIIKTISKEDAEKQLGCKII